MQPQPPNHPGQPVSKEQLFAQHQRMQQRTQQQQQQQQPMQQHPPMQQQQHYTPSQTYFPQQGQVPIRPQNSQQQHYQQQQQIMQQQQQIMQQQYQQQLPQQQQQQQQQQQPPEPAPAPEKVNLGFNPSKALLSKHEQYQQNLADDASDAASTASGEQTPQQPTRPIRRRRPLFSFQVTKLRSWRTGYVRLLRLYADHFSTFDPDTQQVTNTWPYTALTEWLAIPKEEETILLQVGADKLKFKCHTDRCFVLTALLECQANAVSQSHAENPSSGATAAKSNSMVVVNFPQCQRQTRKMTRVEVSLHATPFGLVECHPQTRRVLQTYRYADIPAAAFTSDDPRGIVLYHTKNSMGKNTLQAAASGTINTVGRLFFIHSARQGGNGRSDLLTFLHDQYPVLGLEQPHMTESTSVQQWMEQRRSLGHERMVGPIATTWAVSKSTRRHHVQYVGASDGWVGGIVSRQLAITGRGYLLERDGAGVVNCRKLSNLHGIVRVPSHSDGAVAAANREGEYHASLNHNSSGGDQLVLEFSNGSTCTYTCSNRDALLVSLLDAANTLGNKNTVQVSDVRCAGYCLSSLTITGREAAETTAGSSIFQPISIPVHCLKRVHAVSTAAYSYLTHTGEILEPINGGAKPVNPIQECHVVVEACREFNASVLPTGDGLPMGEKDKIISGSIGALWGLVSELLKTATDQSQQPAPQIHVRDRHLAEQSACTFLQSLYRLSKTTTGYKVTVELTTMQECIPLLWHIQDDFTKFWAFRVLIVLMGALAGMMPKLRDMEVEYVNKNVILNTGGALLVHGLVDALLESGQLQNNKDGQRHQRVNDLILMVVSDMLQNILCSYHDTTSPEHFQAFIRALAKGYRALLSALRSSTPFVIENVALLLHLLSTHAPATAEKIRDAALNSATVLFHFHAAIFSPMEGQRFLSRFLCSLWLSGPPDCDEKRLLRRMVPSGFLNYLNMPLLSRMEEEQLEVVERDNAIEGNISDSYTTTIEVDDIGESIVPSASEAASQSGAAGTNTARLRSRIALSKATVSSQQTARQQGKAPSMQQHAPRLENFRIFFHVLTKDHALADLIWNQQTRRELRIALESEIQYIRREAEARGVDNIAWNHQQFSVEYPSLENELKVGGHSGVYMRLWLQAGDAFIRTWEEPLRLFEQLFRRFLCESDRNPKVTVMCIRCLERLYGIHAKSIGPFSDAMILVRSMASTRSIETQHRLLGLVATILGVARNSEVDDVANDDAINIPENAEQLLNSESIEQLCQFVAWGHTNGVQVANLLTSILSKNAANQMMLTDGTEAGPGGEARAASGENSNEGRSTSSAPDASCPPVWFIANTGRIPPSAESIQGPFRVSELAKMMKEGDLSPFDLVTASHVEDYDDEGLTNATGGVSSGVKEGQIDTGKWKRIEQVWQLRWQLCTDGTGGGIYSPSDVALLAIRSLSRLVDLHKSLDSTGKPYYPIPIAKRVLCGLSRDPTITSDPSRIQASLNRDSFLAIISQALLCNDHRVVSQAADVLYKLMLHNEEAVAKFYLTGAFLFACCYTGSNFKPLARLLHATHLSQHFRSGFAAAANEAELSMKERSILGHLIPEGVLFMLVNYGVDRFTEVFVGNFDTPEVIWNFEMRKHLVEMVKQHLGTFPRRLWQNTTTQYEYCPMPGVAYERLEKEIFCHNYYLNNLCDEVRFPDWPIAEPVDLFRACLDEFKNQLTRDETEEEVALETARKVLGLQPGDGSKELRKAYRTLARKYHPDKNPAGREQFEATQKGYELLLPIVESGQTIRAFSENNSPDGDGDDNKNIYEGFGGGKTQMQALHVLMKTQLLICRRFEKVMGKYKYPAYSMVLKCLEIPASCAEAASRNDSSALLFACMTQLKRAEFVQTTVALVFQTCLVSPLNSEELVSDGGIIVLESLLNYYINVAHNMRKSCASDFQAEDVVTDIISNIVHTVAGIAYFSSGRVAISSLQDPARLGLNWRRCLDGKYLLGKNRENFGDSTIKRYALEGVANMAKDKDLQALLIGSGIIWPLMKFMLGYDPTLELVATTQDDQDDVGTSQAASNTQARLATRALGMLCGVLQDPAMASPKNEALSVACSKLLTSPVALMLRNKRTAELLRTLNTNIETPARIWNVGMRNELNAFLAHAEKGRPESECQSVEAELSGVGSFEYSLLKEELRIGGVYVRVFNRMGSDRGAIREIPNPTAFAKQVTDFIAKSINASKNLPDAWVPLPLSFGDDSEVSPFLKDEAVQTVAVRDSRFLMAIQALLQLVRVDGLIDDVLCEPSSAVPSVLLSLLELPQDSETFDIGSDILSILSPKQPFADAVARQGAIWRLLWVLERPEATESSSDRVHADDQENVRRKVKGWLLMESLSSTPSVATKLVESSCWLELLGIVVGFGKFTKSWAARVGAAKTLSRLLWDPNTGPQASPLLQRFLPPTLVIILKEEGPEVMLKKFDGESDTPELIWDSSMRAELRTVLASQLDNCLKNRKERLESNDTFVLPPAAFVKYTKLNDEMYIGGVYVSRFLKEPTYNLRDPTTFLEMILQRWTHEIQTYFSNDGATVDEGASTALTDARLDSLQLVTSAIVYLCKIRDSLCDKLAQWGYMARCLTFLDEVLKRELYGSPLLSVIRVLHVASNRLVNVEAIAIAGRSDGKHSVVDYSMKAIGSDSLHPDSGFMVEMLKKVYKQALGDVKKGAKSSTKLSAHSMQHPAYALAPSPAPGDGPVGDMLAQIEQLSAWYQEGYDQPNLPFAMAPSPSPGEGPVQRGKVSMGDDPLAMMGFAGEMTPQAPPPGSAVPGSQNQFSQQRQATIYASSSFSSQGNMEYNGDQPALGQQAYSQQPVAGPPLHHAPQRQQQVLSNGPPFQRQVGSPQAQGFHKPPGSRMSATEQAGNAVGGSAQASFVNQQHSSYQKQLGGSMNANTMQAGLNTPVVQNLCYQQQNQWQQGKQNNEQPSYQQPHHPQQQHQQQHFQAQQQFPAQQQPPQQQKQQGFIQNTLSQGVAAAQQFGNSVAATVKQNTLSQGVSAAQQFGDSIAATVVKQMGHQALQKTLVQQPQSQASQQPHAQQQQQQHVGPFPSVGGLAPTPYSQVGQAPPQQMGSHSIQQAPYQQQIMNSSSQQPHVQPTPGGMPANAPQFMPQQQGMPGNAAQFFPQQQWMPANVPQFIPQHQPQLQTNSQYNPQQQTIPQQSQIPGQMHVETVTDDLPQHNDYSSDPPPKPQYRPTAVEGSGVDARTKADPKVEAEQSALSMAGAPGSADGRVALLQAALVNELPKFLLQGVLENASLSRVKDPATTKVHTVELLKLFTMDPGYGKKFELILNDMPAWKKYKSQDHSLFITSTEQKADYFLTDGSSGEPTKLLTQG